MAPSRIAWTTGPETAVPGIARAGGGGLSGGLDGVVNRNIRARTGAGDPRNLRSLW